MTCSRQSAWALPHIPLRLLLPLPCPSICLAGVKPRIGGGLIGNREDSLDRETSAPSDDQLLAFPFRFSCWIIPALRKAAAILHRNLAIFMATVALSTSQRLACLSATCVHSATFETTTVTGAQWNGAVLTSDLIATASPRQGKRLDNPSRLNVEKRGRERRNMADEVVREAVTLLREKHIDADRYSSADWERMRAEAREEVESVNPNVEEGRARDEIARGRAEAAAVYAKLGDRYTRVLHPVQLDQLVLHCEGMQVNLGLGMQLQRTWWPLMPRHVVRPEPGTNTATNVWLPPTTAITRINPLQAIGTGLAVDWAITRAPTLVLHWVPHGFRKDSGQEDTVPAPAPLDRRRCLTIAATVAFVLCCDSLVMPLRPVVVRSVDTMGPADEAGIRPGDVVLRLGKQSCGRVDIRATNRAIGWLGGERKHILRVGQPVLSVIWRKGAAATKG
ncbi:unnamed protein product, partial [Discosporangium mesarthrocarpum]